LFLWQACREWGYPHPDYLLATLTPEQLDELRTYYEIEPWGGPVDDYRAASISWAIFQVQSRKRLDIHNFKLKWGPQDPLRPQDYRAKAQRMYAAMAGRAGKGRG
jgi:hypothetical protein